MTGMDVSLGSMPAMTSSLLLLSILKLQVREGADYAHGPRRGAAEGEGRSGEGVRYGSGVGD
jgi:hypothetical protein